MPFVVSVVVPIVVKVFVKCWDWFFIVLVRLTLANLQLPLNYKLKHLGSFKGSLFLVDVVGWCHYMLIFSKVCTYIYLNCIIILRVFAGEGIFCPNKNRRSRRISDPTHSKKQCNLGLIILIYLYLLWNYCDIMNI
jgi:hypothetical protein